MNSVKTRAKSGVSGPNAHQTPVTPIRPGNKKPKPGNTSGDSGATPNRIKDLKKGAMELEDVILSESEEETGGRNLGSDDEEDENPNPPKKDGENEAANDTVRLSRYM